MHPDPNPGVSPVPGSLADAELKMRQARDTLAQHIGLLPTRFLVTVELYKALGKPRPGLFILDDFAYRLSVTSTNPAAFFCVAYAEG